MKKILSTLLSAVFLLLFIPHTNAADSFFIDVAPDHPQFAAITTLRNEGIINGFADNTFRPDQAVNRAEALKIILLGSDIPEPEAPLRDPFVDVNKDAWFATFVREGKRRNIISGIAGGEFEPERTVLQAEALKMLLLTNEIPVDTPASNPFDNVPADEWFAPYYEEGKVRQIFGTAEIRPGKELTRGDLAYLMYRFIDGAQTYSYPIGIISYYGGRFEGQETSSGEVFDSSAYTAAHRTLNMGTEILVHSYSSGKSVAVTVNDRGPYVSFRHLDLSRGAFEVLENLGAGVMKGEVEVVTEDVPLGPVDEFCNLPTERSLIGRDSFQDISLSGSIPTVFRENEVFTIRGTTTASEGIKVILQQGDEQEQYSAAVQNGQFSIAVPLLEAGDFEMGVLPGTSGSVKLFPIQVRAGTCFSNIGEQPPSITNIQENIQNGDYTLTWDAPQSDFFRVVFSQQDKIVEFFVNGDEQFTPPPQAFEDFTSGPAQVRIFAATLDSLFSADIASPYSASTKKDIVLSQHYFSEIDTDQVAQSNFPETFTFGSTLTWSAQFTDPIREYAVIIEPDGTIVDVPLQINGQNFSLQFTPQKIGTHIIEINSEGGIAIVNMPVYVQGFAPVLPDYFDLAERQNSTNWAIEDLERNRMLLRALSNQEREASGLQRVDFREDLNEIAQLRAEDMARRNYFSHTTPEDTTVTDLAQQVGFFAKIGENIALDTDLEFAHEQLMRSAIHRRNILQPHWSYVGIGVAKNNEGSLVIVQLFGEEPLSLEERENYREQMMALINAQREEDFSVDESLQAAAGMWAEKMVLEGFFGLESNNGTTLQKLLPDFGIQDRVLISLYRYSSLSDFLTFLQISEDADYLRTDQWNDIGIGMYIDEAGLLTIVVLVRE